MDWFLSRLFAEQSSAPSCISNLFAIRGLNSDNSLCYSLNLELPPIAVFNEGDQIPTVSLVDLFVRRFRNGEGISNSPQYLILKINRFVKNDFFTEKNSTIVRYPVKGLDMSDWIDDDKADSMQEHLYDLVGLMSHEGTKPDCGSFKAYIIHPQAKETSHWLECEGLRIKKFLPQSVALVEAFAMIWKKRPH
jgi:U4/U6.U5 tri-snRNP-associated protein 2